MSIEKKIRRVFNENNKADVEAYRQFLVNSSWGHSGCPFLLEEPFASIPGMIDNKLIRKFLKIQNVH